MKYDAPGPKSSDPAMEDGSTIALLGQPNAGKSTLFNALTGSRQHVGNWPGKTVEKKTGTFVRNGRTYSVVDLPGSYGLHACSQEEVITRDFIASGRVGRVCLLVDASQLERSLFMLADFLGLDCPVVLVLNMMDVAAEKGIDIDADAMSNALGVPVAAMCAADKTGYGDFFAALESPVRCLDPSALERRYETDLGGDYRRLRDLVAFPRIGVYSRSWLVSKMMEGDRPAMEIVKEAVGPEVWARIEAILDTVRDGALHTGACKFAWIRELLGRTVPSPVPMRPPMGRFDRLATSRRWGMPMAFAMMIAGLMASFILTIPWMMLSWKAPRLVSPAVLDLLSALHAGPWLLSLTDVALKATGTAVGMAGFVGGSALVFGFMEDVGYMARIAYVFDHVMTRLGLQGKAVMPILMSFGCPIGGAVSARVIDSWGQRVLTIALSWTAPCAATWGVVSVFGAAFFGLGTVWVLAALFAGAVLVMAATARLFAPGLLKGAAPGGLIMELPPYHRPKWKSLFRFAFVRMGEMLKRALGFIVSLSVLFWVFAYSADGNIESSILYRIGQSVEPVTLWFGLRWQTFIAFVCSMMGKEAALGVLSSVFGAASTVVGEAEVSPDLAVQLKTVLSKPEALAFVFAFFFNVPCFVAVLSVRQESHSWSWTLRMAGWYIAVALVMSTLAYHAGKLIF